MKNWPRKSVLACGVSLLACAAASAQSAPAAPAKVPGIALLDEADAAQWQTWSKEVGWKVVAPAGAANPNIDQRVQALETAVGNAIRNAGVDPARVYLADRGDAAAAVFYAISRVPDLWAAGVALGGSPQPAIDSGRVFTANFTNTPVLWISSGADDQALAKKLKSDGLNLEWRSSTGATTGALFEWLAAHSRSEFPDAIDCETNSPTFASCYWIQMTKFDTAERNDVLPSTRVKPSSGAALDLGGFGYKTDDPGPGILVSFLPEKYSGPLKMGDRILALDGKPIANAREYAEAMGKTTDEKPVAAMVQRGKDRIRLETRIVLPKREAPVSARVQGRYKADDKTILIISRTVTEMRVTIPQHWLPADLYWNGLSMENLSEPGCRVLKVEKELLHAGKCQ